MHTHVLNTYNHTGDRPQGCQVREHAWRQLLKLVVAKVQIPVAKQKVEIDQIEPEQIVSARDRHSSRKSSVRAIATARVQCRRVSRVVYVT
jgi:hypothetical protein